MKQYQEYAKATLERDTQVSIQISKAGLVMLKSQASEEGISYETLMSDILHKHTSGHLIESDA